MSMSRRMGKKMLSVGINTEALVPEAESNKTVHTRLKERDVKHLRIKDSAELHQTYNFREEIGRGGFGKVLSVGERHKDKDWAIKVISKAAIGNKLETVYREIQILKMVDHPHIIYLDRVYESTKKIYLILELCYNVLSKLFREQKCFSESDTKKIIRDLADAIAYLHKNDIVHRDLKLENILLAENPLDKGDKLYIKVSDFGLSIVKQGSGYENMLHDCCGTIFYMAPEVITTNSYSQQCDVWAAGVIMYTLLSGRYPFFSVHEQELSTMICKNEPSFSEFSASPEAIHLIKKMLTKNPALRISAGEAVHHPWIMGKPMTHDMDSPQNVLDMMGLWRSEMMLPIGADCDWISPTSAQDFKEASPRNSTTLLHTFPIISHAALPSEEPTATGLETKPQKQSMRLPVKNIRFERPANQSAAVQAPYRQGSLNLGVEDPRASRRGSNAPSTSSNVSASRRSPAAPKRAGTPTSNEGNKSQTSKTRNKGWRRAL